MSEPVDSVAAGAELAPGEAQGLRVALSPYLFRGMLVGMAAVAVALHRVTGSRKLAWRFAKARARTLAQLLGLRVRLHGLEHLAGGGPPGGRLAGLPGEVEVVVEVPIPTTGLTYDDRDALARRVREAIERHHTGW